MYVDYTQKNKPTTQPMGHVGWKKQKKCTYTQNVRTNLAVLISCMKKTI